MVTAAMPHTPTAQQQAVIEALVRFCSKATPQLSVFVLNGYAGTGKTSVVAALVKSLRAVRYGTALLAPTGRAAKVLGTMAGRQAFTIHRKIYRTDGAGNTVAIAGVADNPHRNTVFIVDEASMIGGDGDSTLLDDLLQYVYNGDNCRIIFVGDTAQLPPVGCEESPAMSVKRLHDTGLRVSRAILTQTVRQASDSGILYNATMLRRMMRLDPLVRPKLATSAFADVRTVTPEDLEDALSSSYSRFGIDETIIITRSNSRAMRFNLAVRESILGKEEDISRDEPLLIARNNYHWTAKVRGADFLANGDIARVAHIYGSEIRGYLRFADVRLALPDRDIELDTKIILSSLNAESAGLSPDHELEITQLALRDAGITEAASPTERAKAFRNSHYYNALRVKYAYAVTCHKAQGGQWESVFVDMAGISAEAETTIDFYRWLYTAATRARSLLTFVRPRDND